MEITTTCAELDELANSTSWTNCCEPPPPGRRHPHRRPRLSRPRTRCWRNVLVPPETCWPTVRFTAAIVPLIGAVSVASDSAFCALVTWFWAAVSAAWSAAIWVADASAVWSESSRAWSEDTVACASATRRGQRRRVDRGEGGTRADLLADRRGDAGDLAGHREVEVLLLRGLDRARGRDGLPQRPGAHRGEAGGRGARRPGRRPNPDTRAGNDDNGEHDDDHRPSGQAQSNSRQHVVLTLLASLAWGSAAASRPQGGCQHPDPLWSACHQTGRCL